MATRDKERLDRQFRQLEKKLPDWIGKFVRWLRKPSSRWVRIPVAILFIGGGILGFLPLLGFWMVPLGLLFLAQDIPFLRKPIGLAIVGVQRWWVKWKKKIFGKK
jgi:hypothetical protein